MVIKLITVTDMSFKEFKGHEGTIRSLAIDPRMDRLVLVLRKRGGKQGEGGGVNNTPPQPRHVLTRPVGWPQVSAAEDGYLRLWNLQTGEVIEEISVFPSVQGGADP